jgi:hypothetical protein
MLLAQNASTSLRGTVTDPTGAVVPGAIVEITNPAVGFKSAATADGRGEYSFQQLTPGKYTIRVSAPGFHEYSVTSNLLVAQPATLNASLSITESTTSVDVSASAETINTTDASIGNAINNETIMALPSEARNPQTLLALQPGVLYLGNTSSADSRNGVVSGARADQTNITLDGLDNNNQIAPAAFTGVLRTTLDSTEEFRVTTSNSNADTGRSSGGQVNLVTKSGTNKLHGSLYEYNRSSIGIANDWFNKSAQLQSGVANRPGKLVRNTYGASLGGPLLRDKLFLFGNYEGNRQNESVTATRTVPTASLRAGTLKYYANDGTVVSLSRAQVAGMDPNCSTLGTCPQGPGADPASLALFAKYPLPNGSLSGDGLNTASYSFSAPAPLVQNVYISRMDFNPSAKHRFYVRGSMQNDTDSSSTADAPQFPGLPSNYKSTDDSKGITGNYTWAPTSNAVNNLRYGFIRQSIATSGVGKGSFVTFRTLDTPTGTSRSSSTIVPTQNLIDDFTITKGRHTIQVGGNYRRFTYENSTDANSYSSAQSNAYWLANASISGSGGSLDPAAFGYAPVSNGSGSAAAFSSNYDFAVSMLAGLVTQQNSKFNYTLSSDGKTGTLLAQGAPVARSFRSNEVEYYIQDTWHPLPNLTLTAGIRHSILQTPFETNGQQVQPTINIHDWFATRGAQAALGNSVQPDISYSPSGQARGAKPFYPMNWGNVAPRFAFVFTPTTDAGSLMNKVFGGAGKSSIRAGFGIYYDHYGQGLVTNYSRAGSFSLSSTITNPASVLTTDTSPRFTGISNLPTLVPSAAGTISYPQTPSNDPNGTGFAITQGLDDHLKTPYSEVFNLSWQRELPGGFTFEADYVGRLGRHLLQQEDLAQPLDLVDPKSGMDYYTAGTILSKAVDSGAKNVAAIPYFENLFADAKTSKMSATQNIYSNLWQYVRGNETAALYNLDILCDPGCGGKTGRFWPLQYSSLYVTSSLGSSSYNAGQFILRHPMKHNVQMDLSYTYSKSLDMGSDSESNPTNTNNNYGFILDAFNPRKNRSISDFNTKHLVTADWVLRLPVGQGQHFAGNTGRLVNALVGGWYVSGILRASSGLPFGVSDGNGWSTNWEYESYEVQTGPIKMRKHLDKNGSPQAFDDPTAALKNLRASYPGEAGQRNNFMGDGYFDVDSGLHKDVSVTDHARLHFAWEVFNVTNSVRFDPHALDTGSTDGTQLGVYSGLLTQSRRMQLSGRIEF